MYNGLKVEGQLQKGFYNRNQDKGHICLNAWSYASTFTQLEGCTLRNDTDIMADYFDKDRLYIPVTSIYYKDALKAYEQQELKQVQRFGKRLFKNFVAPEKAWEFKILMKNSNSDFHNIYCKSSEFISIEIYHKLVKELTSKMYNNVYFEFTSNQINLQLKDLTIHVLLIKLERALSKVAS
jgi:hypothetical protein